jgi:dTDP-4-dehydrorhamnose 3,5-epimerase-like enzyme
MESSLIQLVNFQLHGDARGKLSVAEVGGALPFAVRRIYWIYGTKPGVSRGFHAHKKLNQLCVCIAGSLRIRLFDGTNEEDVSLNEMNVGLKIPPRIWHEMHDLSHDCVLIVFAENEYDENDYIRDRSVFIRHVTGR